MRALAVLHPDTALKHLEHRLCRRAGLLLASPPLCLLFPSFPLLLTSRRVLVPTSTNPRNQSMRWKLSPSRFRLFSPF